METAYYIINTHLPVYTWPLLLLIFLFSMLLCAWIGRRNGNRKKKWTYPILISLLVTYIAAILFTTLIFRTPAANPDGTPLHKAAWMPLWSWHEVIAHHDMALLEEILLNIILFIPFGALLTLFSDMKASRICPIHAFLIGFLFSAMIETTQLITCRGLFEWDDMLHNGLGSLLGYGIVGMMLSVWSSRKRA